MFLVFFLALCGFASAIDVVHPVHRQDFPLSWNHGEPVSVPFQAYPARPSAGVYRVSRQEFAEPRQHYMMSPYVAYHQIPPRTMYWYPPVNGNRFQAYPADPMAPTINYVPKLFVPAADQVKRTPHTVNRPSFANVPVPQPAPGIGAADDSVLPATRRPSESEGEPLAPVSGGVTKPPNKYFSYNDDVEVNFELKDLLAPLKPAHKKSAESEEQFERFRRFAMHTVEVPPSEITPNNFLNLLFRPDEAVSKTDSVTESPNVDAGSEKDAVTDLPASTSTTEATESAMVSEDTPAEIACEYAAEPSFKLIPIETVEVSVVVKPVIYYLGIITVGASNSGDAEDDSTTTPASLLGDEGSDLIGLTDPRSSPESTAFPPEGTDSDGVESSTLDLVTLILGPQKSTSEPETSTENVNASPSDNPSDYPSFSEVRTTDGEPNEDAIVGEKDITDALKKALLKKLIGDQSISVPELPIWTTGEPNEATNVGEKDTTDALDELLKELRGDQSTSVPELPVWTTGEPKDDTNVGEKDTTDALDELLKELRGDQSTSIPELPTLDTDSAVSKALESLLKDGALGETEMDTEQSIVLEVDPQDILTTDAILSGDVAPTLNRSEVEVDDDDDDDDNDQSGG